jgi:tRNA (guanine-N7-)-methyltransferase
LTNEDFLKKYHHVLHEEGIVHLKTDSEFMHGYTLGLLHGQGQEVLYAHHDIYNNPHAPEVVLHTQTFYEKQYLEIDKAITYIKFKLKY